MNAFVRFTDISCLALINPTVILQHCTSFFFQKGFARARGYLTNNIFLRGYITEKSLRITALEDFCMPGVGRVKRKSKVKDNQLGQTAAPTACRASSALLHTFISVTSLWAEASFHKWWLVV